MRHISLGKNLSLPVMLPYREVLSRANLTHQLLQYLTQKVNSLNYTRTRENDTDLCQLKISYQPPLH